MSCEKFDEFIQEVDAIVKKTEVPVWANILIGCFKSLICEIKSLSVLQAERISNLEDKTNVQGVIAENLKLENERLRDEIEILNKAVDHNEQVSRSSNLLIHGVPEEVNEMTDAICCKIIKEKLNIDMTVDDIARSHRLGPVKTKIATRNSKSFPMPIFVIFVSLRKRLEVYRSKRDLKGSNLVITENLTKKRYELYRDSMKKLGKANVWTSDGRILCKSGNSIIVISSHDDLK